MAEEAGPIGVWEGDIKEILRNTGSRIRAAVRTGAWPANSKALSPGQYFHASPQPEVRNLWRSGLCGAMPAASRRLLISGSVTSRGGPPRKAPGTSPRRSSVRQVPSRSRSPFVRTFHVVQRLKAAARAGRPPGSHQVVWNRSEGARRSALAHLNLWVREVYPQWAGPRDGRSQIGTPRKSDRRT